MQLQCTWFLCCQHAMYPAETACQQHFTFLHSVLKLSVRSYLQASAPPPPVQISGTAISGAPIVPPPPPPANVDIPLLPKKPLLLPLPLKKKILPLLLVCVQVRRVSCCRW